MSTYNAVQAAINAAQPIPFVGGTNLLKGDKGAKAISCLCDFSATGIPSKGYTIDPTVFLQKGYIKTVQALYIDNSANNNVVTVSNPTFGQTFSLPAGWQGYFPILASDQSQQPLQVTSIGSAQAYVILLNVLMPLGIWAATATPSQSTTPQPTADAILDATVSGNQVQVFDSSANTELANLLTEITALAANLANVTIGGGTQISSVQQTAERSVTDHSGTITAGGTAQVAAAVNNSRQGIYLQNLDTTEDLWFSLSGTAAVATAGSFSLSPGTGTTVAGGAWQNSNALTNAISVIAATTGHKFSLMTW